jgi:ankyrin repeat protein
VVELLLTAGAKTEARSDAGNTALILASSFGNVDAVRALLRWGADKNAAASESVGGSSAVGAGSEAGSGYTNNNNNNNNNNSGGSGRGGGNGATPLIYATANGHSAVVEALVAAGAKKTRRVSMLRVRVRVRVSE